MSKFFPPYCEHFRSIVFAFGITIDCFAVPICGFSERFTSDKKKSRQSTPDTTEYVSEDSVFDLLANVDEIAPVKVKTALSSKETNSFTNLLNQNDDDDDVGVTEEAEGDSDQEEKPTNHVPIDWSLKTKLRLLSKNPIPGSRLKCNEEASGITGYVPVNGRHSMSE